MVILKIEFIHLVFDESEFKYKILYNKMTMLIISNMTA